MNQNFLSIRIQVYPIISGQICSFATINKCWLAKCLIRVLATFLFSMEFNDLAMFRLELKDREVDCASAEQESGVSLRYLNAQSCVVPRRGALSEEGTKRWGMEGFRTCISRDWLRIFALRAGG